MDAVQTAEQVFSGEKQNHRMKYRNNSKNILIRDKHNAKAEQMKMAKGIHEDIEVKITKNEVIYVMLGSYCMNDVLFSRTSSFS